MTAPVVFEPDLRAIVAKIVTIAACVLLFFCGRDFEKAKDALLKAAGMYSQAVADWPDGGED